MGSGINYKRDDYMVKKLLDIVNKYFKEVIIIDDSIYDNSTIYKLIDTLFFTKLSHYLPPTILTDEDMDFLANFACKDIPKPRNLSEQLKYMKLCANFNFVENEIANVIEFGKGYDISGCKYVYYGDMCIVKNGKLEPVANDLGGISGIEVTLVNNILTFFKKEGTIESTYQGLCSKVVYIPLLEG